MVKPPNGWRIQPKLELPMQSFTSLASVVDHQDEVLLTDSEPLPIDEALLEQVSGAGVPVKAPGSGW